MRSGVKVQRPFTKLILPAGLEQDIGDVISDGDDLIGVGKAKAAARYAEDVGLARLDIGK